MVRKTFVHSLMGGLVALTLLGGIAAAAYAQTDDSAAPAAPSTVVPAERGSGSLIDSDQALADALGITLEELTAAAETARNALIDQAVADGRLTQEQGEALKATDARLHGSRLGYDKNEFLADALGITVEELEAAKLDVYEQELAARVAAGDMTQEEADLKLAQKAAQYYLDTDALNEQVRAAYETAIAAAVDAGAITQAQADALLAQLATQTFDFGFGGRGGRGGHGGHGGRGGFHGDSLTIPETTPDTTTTAFDA